MNIPLPPKRNRHGITLVEVLAAMTVGVLAASIGLGLITSLFLVNTKTKKQTDRQRTLARFTETFCEDAHQARDAKLKETTAKPKSLVLQQDAGRAVCYTFGDGRVIREMTTNEKRTAYDTFTFGRNTVFDISLETATKKQLATIAIRNVAIRKAHYAPLPITVAIGTSPSSIELLLPSETKEPKPVETPSETSRAVDEKDTTP